MSNQDAIVIKNLNKMYKIFHKPSHKVMDLLGLGRLLPNNEEFWALKDINLQIKKGSKVALVGRNGAGKSTLLKLIAGNIKQTSGDLQVNGNVSALMELGTGFHPEFSGKENIFASLSYSGIVGKGAKEKYEEIVDFTELEEFIHKPVKTYSAGMYTRLAFATSTAIKPEILIIDEILGAGDAYFINKSIERMKRLTEGGTTVLFVSHDITSAQKLCSEAIWIDRGRVQMEGDILQVTAEYLASIRNQEEKRLKARNIRLKHNDLKTLEESINSKLTYFHFIGKDGAPQYAHPIKKLSMYYNQSLIASLPLGSDGDTDPNNDLFLLVDKKTINWSDPIQKDGHTFRHFQDLGGSYQHAVFAYKTPTMDDLENYFVEVEYMDNSNEDIFLEYFNGEEYVHIGVLNGENDNKWKLKKIQLNSNEENKVVVLNKGDVLAEYQDLMEVRKNNIRAYGTGEVIIKEVQFLNLENKDSHIFENQGYKKVRIHYLTPHKIFKPVFVVAYYLLDGTCVTQLISSKDGFNIKEIEGEGYIDITMNPILLGRGHYLISVAIFKELNILDNVEPPAYDLHDKMYEIKIEQPFGINVELGLVNHPVEWEMENAKG